MDTNVLSNVYLYNMFMPQILKGKAKKVVVISSGAGDAEWVKDYDLDGSSLYAASKSAMNMITAKFSAQYKKDGVLFMSICPGMVEVGHFANGIFHHSSIKTLDELADLFAQRLQSNSRSWEGWRQSLASIRQISKARIPRQTLSKPCCPLWRSPVSRMEMGAHSYHISARSVGSRLIVSAN